MICTILNNNILTKRFFFQMDSKKIIEPYIKIGSSVTSMPNEMSEKEQLSLQHIPQGFMVNILPMKFSLKVMYKVEKLQHIFWGILVRPNGEPIETNNIINFDQFASLYKEKAFTKNPLFYLCEKSQAIRVIYRHQMNPENQLDQMRILEKFWGEISKLKKIIVKILQILGVFEMFSKTRRQLRYFQLEDKKILQKIIPSHERNENHCCQKQHQNQFSLKPFSGQCIKKVKNIIFQQMNEEKKEKFVTGSFCQIKKESVLIQREEKQSTQENERLTIAIKTLKAEYKNDEKKKEKIMNEKRIISHLKNSKYIINVIEPVQKINEEQVYLEYIEENLKEKLNRFQFSLYQKFSISEQILKAIKNLHHDGVVHRDLKPQNILINKKNKIKLIDFSESIQIGTEFNPKYPNKLGCTIPYSPLECGTLCYEGYSNSKIDNWSVGMIMCELIETKMPFPYPKLFEKEMKKNWIKNDDFFLNINIRRKKGIRLLQGFAKVIIYLLLRQKQSERFCLSGALQVLQIIQRRFKRIFNI